LLRVAIAAAGALTVDTITGYAWAHILGTLVIVAWRPWKDRGSAADSADVEDDQWLLSGLVLSAAASQALLLASPLVASRLGATDTEYSVIYATLLVARAPLTIGYNLIARILPSFTAMSATGERRELRAWARGIGFASMLLALGAAAAGAVLGPVVVGVTMGSGFMPSSGVGAMAGASVVFAGGGLFIGQILVAKSQPARLAIAWMTALAAAIATLFVPIDDPVVRATLSLLVGEFTALVGLMVAALVPDAGEVEISHGYAVAKRSMDIAGAIVLLMITFPIMLIAAIAVKLDSKGPAFFRQQRVGRDAQEFWMVKIRTMHIDDDGSTYREHLERLRASIADDVDYSIRIEDDPRVTRVGAKLRKWSIDELPNLFNVLKGSMSLVGPRPLVVEEAELVGLSNRRFDVKPGLTGLAQVGGRDSLHIERRAILDERYVDQRSFKLDLKILLATVKTVFVEPGDVGNHEPTFTDTSEDEQIREE
ncbi:MAG: sugar transferase, partial [Armatimonadetes bacterium]